MSVRVSVVVPVYNPGRYLEPLVDSLLAQTLDPDRFEVVFVDDGSTDTTPARLDELAAEHPNFSVVHQPNSGWPGKPRNVGIDRARGDYVFFSDHDDWFGAESLERLVRVADEQGADIVLGRMVGHNRGVPRELFRRDRFDATLDNTQLEDSLTPHKLFRRQLLVDHDLRFPEGKRRLEDHVFVMKAYFAAKRICVVSDYDYYHHISRDDESNAGYGDFDPAAYYGYVRETIDVVLANSTPGPVQDRLLRRFASIEVLGRVADPRLADAPEGYRRDLFDAARRLVVETMPESVDRGMRARQRLLTRHLRDGDEAALAQLAAEVPTVVGELTGAGWDGPLLAVRWRASVQETLLRPLPGGGWTLAAAGEDVPVERDLRVARVDVVAVDDHKGERIVGSGPVRVDDQGRLFADGTAEVDAAALDDGTWWFRFRLRALGWVTQSGAVDATAAWPRVPAAVVGGDAALVRPAALRSGTAVLDVGAAARWLDDALVAEVRVRRGDLRLPAPRGAEVVQVRVGTAVADLPVSGDGWVRNVAELGVGAVHVRGRRGTGRWIGLALRSGGTRLSRARGDYVRAVAQRVARAAARRWERARDGRA